jgi:hypothetical protein
MMKISCGMLVQFKKQYINLINPTWTGRGGGQKAGPGRLIYCFLNLTNMQQLIVIIGFAHFVRQIVAEIISHTNCANLMPTKC